MEIKNKYLFLAIAAIFLINFVSAVQYSFDNNDKLGIFNVTNVYYLNASTIQVGSVDVCLSDGTNCIAGSGGNASWNESYADGLYAPLGAGNSSFNQSLTDSLYAPIGAGSDNVSWNESYADTKYSSIEWGYNQTEGLNVNTTQMSYTSGYLTILTSWFSDFFDTLFGAKTTDDLTQGSTNLYDNQSWNETKGDEIYSDIKWAYNQTQNSDNDWIIRNSTMDFNFNESKLEVTYYNSTSYTAVAGTTQGQLSYTQHKNGVYDDLSFNITEIASSPGLDIRFNFTDGITTFTQGVIRYKALTVNGNSPLIQLWDYNHSSWETYSSLDMASEFFPLSQSVFDSSNHVQNGTVRMRIYKSAVGNPSNKYEIDWLAIAKGFGVPAGEETDPFAIHKDGSTVVTANIPFEPYNLSAVWIKGLFNWTVLNNWLTFNGATLSFNETKLNNTIAREGLRVGFNSTFNQTYANYAYNQSDGSYNITYQNYAYNQTTAANIYTDTSSINLQLNISGVNTTSNIEGLGFSQGSHTTIWDTLFNNTLLDYLTTWLSGLTTDDLTQGTTNLYDNRSWNQSLADSLYTGGSGDNASWNESYADTKYGQLSQENTWLENQTLNKALVVGDGSIYWNGTVLKIEVN